MKGSVLINQIDIAAAFNVMLEKGGLSVFETPPKMKEPFFNDWVDQSGKDYDEDAKAVYESQSFEIPFLIFGEGVQDYRKKKREFLDLIEGHNEFDFQILDWGEAFRLRFKEANSWKLLNKSMEGRMFARFILKLECNFNPMYVFKYLADNSGRYIVINDNQKMLVKTTYKNRYGR